MARYVDDIIIVVHPDLDDEHWLSLNDYVKSLIDTYAKHGLTIHTPTDGTGKCYIYDSLDKKNLKFELLGYTIESRKGDKDKQGFFSLSRGKIQKIKDRINKTFQNFDNLLNIVSVLIGISEATANTVEMGIDQYPTISAENITVNLQ